MQQFAHRIVHSIKTCRILGLLLPLLLGPSSRVLLQLKGLFLICTLQTLTPMPHTQSCQQLSLKYIARVANDSYILHCTSIGLSNMSLILAVLRSSMCLIHDSSSSFQCGKQHSLILCNRSTHCCCIILIWSCCHSGDPRTAAASLLLASV